MAKLLLIFPSQKLFRSFFTKEFIEPLIENHDVIIILNHKEMDSKSSTETIALLNQCSQYSYSENPNSQRLNQVGLLLEMVKNRELSVSFDTRIRIQLEIPESIGFDFFSIISLKRFKLLFLLVFPNTKLYDFVRHFLLKFLTQNSALNRVLNSQKGVDKIVIFSGGTYSGIENYVCGWARKRKIPIGMVVDNWDNLSSKSILWNLPNKIAVWGTEMKNDATKIHGFPEKDVEIIGSSRVNIPVSNSDLRKVNDLGEYVLFAGSGFEFDNEFEHLRFVRSAMDVNGLKEVRLVYRPHPWTLRFKDARSKIQKDFFHSNILVDPDVLINESRIFYNREGLSYLEQLVINSKFVIAAHSTVIIESLYHGKNVAVITKLNHPLFKTNNSWKLYTHMRSLEHNDGLYSIQEHSDWDKTIKLLEQGESMGLNLVPNVIPNFDNQYAIRLKNFIEKI